MVARGPLLYAAVSDGPLINYLRFLEPAHSGTSLLERHRVVTETLLKPLPAHRHVLDHGHSVVDWAEQRVRIGRDDRERGESFSHVGVAPRVPQAREHERLSAAHPHSSKLPAHALLVGVNLGQWSARNGCKCHIAMIEMDRNTIEIVRPERA